MSQRIYIKANRNVCSGCLSCVTTCSLVNELYVSLAGSRVQVELSPFEGTHQIFVCQQCVKAQCAQVCPENAISRNEAAVWVIDYNLCTGCRLCIDACPFRAMFWNPISGKVMKCEMCHGDPQCVQVCPTAALTIQVVPTKGSEPVSGP